MTDTPTPRPTREGREGDSQPLPIGNDLPIMHVLVAEELPPMLSARLALGIERYGQPLQPLNGRDAAHDALEEAVDLIVYLRQCQFEMVAMRSALREALPYIEASVCRSRDGIGHPMGPCWTCQDLEEHCPKAALIELIGLATKVVP